MTNTQIFFFKLFLINLILAYATSTVFELAYKRLRYTQALDISTNEDRFLEAKELHVLHEDSKDYLVIDLSLGTPSQTFSVQIDTTTPVTWVPSATGKNLLNITATFNSTLSASAEDTNTTLEIEDEDGDVEGFVTYDNIDIQGLKAENFPFVQVTEYDENFQDHSEGKLGLGYRNEFGGDFSILQKLKDSGVIKNKIFALSETKDSNGKLFIGDFPENTTQGYTFCNLTTSVGLDDFYRDSWICELSFYFIGEAQNFSQANKIQGRVIFDSAYSYISAPKKYLSNFKKSYLHNNSAIDCYEVTQYDEVSHICSLKQNATLDDVNSISFLLDGYSYTIDAENLFEKVRDEDNKYEFLIKFYDENDDVWSFGYPFFSQFLVVFDMESSRIGLKGGKVNDFSAEWKKWDENEGYLITDVQMKYLIYGASILGAIIFVFIIFIIIHSIRRRRLEEHGPLIEDGH